MGTVTTAQPANAPQVIQIGGAKFEALQYEPALARKVFKRNLVECLLQRVKGHAGPSIDLPTYLTQLRELRYEHLALRLDASYASDENVRDNLGAPVVQMVTYMFTKAQYRQLRPMKLFCIVRPWRSEDTEQILTLAEQSFHFTRFYQDNFFQKEACAQFYRELAASYCTESAHCGMVVGEKDEQIVGFLGWQKWPEHYGEVTVNVMGRGLGAVLPEHTGCYPGILRHTIDTWQPTQDIAEFDAQLDNPKVIRSYSLLGMQRYRETDVFHLQL